MSIQEQIAAIRRAKVKAITIEGQPFRIRLMPASDSVAFSEFQAGKPKAIESMTRLVSLALADEQGNRVVPDDKEADLRELPLPCLIELFEAAASFNRLDDEGGDELEGKSDGAPADSLPTA